MMKKIILTFTAIGFGLLANAQVGIKTTSPTAGMAIDVNGNVRVATAPVTTNTGLNGTDMLIVRTSTGELKKQKLTYRSTSFKNVSYTPATTPANVPTGNFNTLYPIITSNNTFALQAGDNLYEDIDITNLAVTTTYGSNSGYIVFPHDVYVRLMNADTNTLVNEQHFFGITYTGANSLTLGARVTFVENNLPAGNYRYDLYIRKTSPEHLNSDYSINCANTLLVSYQKITNPINL